MKQKVCKRVAALAIVGFIAATFGGNHAVLADSQPEVKSFCEYGTAVALRIGAGGALWDQAWGEKPNDWYQCEAQPNVGFLNSHAVGVFGTTTSGAPVIDADLILTFPFEGDPNAGGGLLLTEYSSNASREAVGEILLAVHDGIFTADLNASRAVVDEDAGTITIDFGYPVGPGPDAYATIVETSGKFKSIHQEGPWELDVSGVLTIARVPVLDIQTNILAALGNSVLILAAEEEIVLSGSYYRSELAE